MNAPRYAELQVTTQFSFLRGASSAEELFATAATMGIEALAVVDRNSLAGIVRAHEAAKATGIRLIVGCRLDLACGMSVLVYPTDRAAYADWVADWEHRRAPGYAQIMSQDNPQIIPRNHQIEAMISAATYLTIGALLARSQSTLRVRTYVMSLAVLLAAAIGVSRLYLGVHWPSDVLAGWALGSAWALAFWVVSLRVEPTATVE